MVKSRINSDFINKVDFTKVSEGKAKDIILRAIIDPDQRVSTSEEIYTNLFLNATVDDANYLLQAIIDSDFNLATGHIGRRIIYITSGGHIEPFLNNGGFTKLEIVEKQRKEKEFFDFKMSKIKHYTYWPLFILAVISTMLGIYNIHNNLKPDLRYLNLEQEVDTLKVNLSTIENLQTKIRKIDSTLNTLNAPKKTK